MKKEYKSQKELYEHLMPALRCKKHEMHAKWHKIVSEEDIWKYLKDNSWSSSENLTLEEMVNDILNTDDNLIIEYMVNTLKNRE